MKKVTLILAILMATGLAKAQSYTYDSLVNLDFGFYGYDIRSFLELRDGNIVSYSPFYIIDDNGQYVADLGDMLIKVSPDACCFLDSTLMACDDANHCLLERNPQSNDNLFVKIVRDFENVRTDLLIRHFDDNLTYDKTQDIVVPLEDTLITYAERYLLENEENIIVMYDLWSGSGIYPVTPIMVRLGLDGTIKDRVELPDTLIGAYSGHTNNLQVYNESPCEYVWQQTEYGVHPKAGFFVVDSLFRLKEYVRVEESFEPNYIMGSSGEGILPLDEHSYLVYSRFYSVQSNKDNGVRITKYDKTSHENLGSIKFSTEPLGQQNYYTCAIPTDLKKSADGNLYFVYETADPLAPSGFYVGVAKIDNNLNVIWHRYCLQPGFAHRPNLILSLADGGLVVGGYERGAVSGHVSPKMFYLFFHEDGTSVSETEIQVRPYLFWPNPVQNILQLQYSTDVIPTQIELYDLQGRLVHTQRTGLESLNLQGLSAGTYTMRVTLEGGKTFSDKVVKE